MHPNNILSLFLTLGIVKDLPFNLKEKVRMTNMMASVSAVSSILFAFFFAWNQNLQIGLSISLMIPVFAIPLILNHQKKYDWAMNVMLISTGIFLTVLCVLFGPHLQGHLFFGHLIALCAFLFRANNNQYTYYSFFIGLLLFIFGMYIWQSPIFSVNIPFWASSLIFITSILVLALYLYAFNQVISKNEQEVTRLLILAQEKNKELEQAQIDLKGLNKTLEGEVEIRMSELEISNQELRRSNQDLEQFAYAASHDLQEPIRMISNFSRLIEKRLESHFDEDTKSYMGFVRDSVIRMSELIKGLLKYSRVGRKESPYQIANVQDIIENKLQDFQQLVLEKHAKIEMGTLPDSFVCEPNQIGILFANLIHNALKFNHAYPKIMIQAMEEGNSWVFMVADNGIGIKAEYSDQIFEIFRRLHHRDEYDGTGIGLSLCRKIVEQHGGEIWLNSIPNKGTTFFFRLPKIPTALIEQIPSLDEHTSETDTQLRH
ncbi:MAG: ATP-binding protein [Bacteroidia bacterium]